jgi:hypothetical protein
VPARKLTYQVDVDTSGAVGDLERLGTAGARAGKDIADGFDEAKSASTQALDALSAQLDQTEADAKGLAEAVAAIKAHLTVDVDDSKVAGFAADLKGKMGVAFDEVTADAQRFAAVLERGVDLSRTTSEIRGVGTALDDVHSGADQSRSVLANMAGNAAQDMGELSGVTGTLGVGLGQLAEYAADGSISMGNLAKVAGPMAALSAAVYLVGQYTQNVAETKAWERDQVDAYTDAINEAGDSIQAVLTMAEDGLTGRVRDDSILGGILDKEKTIDMIDTLDSFGLTLTDVQDAIRSGATDRTSFVEWMHSGSAEADAFIAKFPNLENSGTQYTEVLEGLVTQATAYTEAADQVAQKNRVMASSIDSVNESLGLMKIDENPLAVLTQGAIAFGDVMVDPAQLWTQLVNDLRDGKADFDYTAQGIDAFATAMHLSKEEVEQLAIEQGKGVKSTNDYQAATKETTDASQAQVDALQAQADATQALIDKQHDMLDATDDLADAQQAWDDGLASFPQTVAESTAAMDEATAGSPEWIDARNQQRDALEGLVEQYVRTTELQAQANGQQLTAAQRVGAQATALGKLAGTLDSSTIPAVAAYYSQLFKIPESKRTEFEMVLASGDQGEIERFVTENSGTKSLAVQVMTNEANLATQQAKIAGVAAPQTAHVTAEAHVTTAKGVIAASFGPVTIPVGADVSSAKSTASQFRREQESTPVYIKVRATTSGTSSGGGYSKPSTLAADPSVSAMASSVPVSVSGDVWSPAMAAPRPINVNVAVSAGVIGSRADVRRAVLDAMAEAERLGRVPAA